jgi:hypothetical protein
MSERGFFAYGSQYASSSECIEEAIEQINDTGEVTISSWIGLKNSGRFIINEVLDEIDISDFFCCDLTGLNDNVLFELGYALAVKKDSLAISVVTAGASPFVGLVPAAAFLGMVQTSVTFYYKSTIGLIAILCAVILIIRYFGGTLLGTGGLVKAYGNSAIQVLKKVTSEELIKKSEFNLRTSYDRFDRIKILLEKYDCSISNEVFEVGVQIKGTVAYINCNNLKNDIIENSNAQDMIEFNELPF